MSYDWEPPEETAATLDGIHSALAHRYRRFVIYELCQSSPLSLSELTDRVHAWDRVERPDKERQTVRSELQRDHLPVLADVDIVEYDESADTIRLQSTGEQAEEIRRLALTQARD